MRKKVKIFPNIIGRIKKIYHRINVKDEGSKIFLFNNCKNK